MRGNNMDELPDPMRYMNHSPIDRIQAFIVSSTFGIGLAHADAGMTNAREHAMQGLEEVIVTARRLEEDQQRVPVAVTALSGEQLARQQVADLHDLQYAAPSLAIWPVLANNMTATISMRGQVEPDLVPTNDPAVGLYLDGVYLARATGANLSLVDMERVEVLRGPQGTLFGRNAIGGAINLVTNKPTRDLEGTVSASVGNYSRWDLTGVFNLPLESPDTAFRVAMKHSEHDGYGHAALLDRDLGDDNTDYVRTQFHTAFADEWTADLSFDLTANHASSQLITFIAAFPPATEIPAAAGNPTDDLSSYSNPDFGAVPVNRAGHFDARVWGASATMTGDLSGVTVKSITAWRQLDLEASNTDLDGTPYDIAATRRRTQDEHQFSQELQAQGHVSDMRADWTAGLTYFTEYAQLNGHSLGLVPLQTTETLLRGIAENDSWAAYAELTGRITPRLRVTGGIRYNVDGRQLISRNAHVDGTDEFCDLAPEILDEPGVCRTTFPRRRFDYVPFTVGIDYAMPGVGLLYAKLSRGQRAGGYNMRGGTSLDFLTFGPEQVTQYEVGVKADLSESRLRANLAIYYSNFEEIQVAQFVGDPRSGTTVIKQNAGQARIDGGELELTALLAPLRLTGSLGVTDGKYTHLDPDVAWVTLDTPLGLPKTTYALAADLPARTGFGRIEIHTGYSWRSDDAGLGGRCDCDNRYGLLDARVSFAFDRSRLSASLWGRNLTNIRYMAQSVDSGELIDDVPGDPRTFGATFDYHFGVVNTAPVH